MNFALWNGAARALRLPLALLLALAIGVVARPAQPSADAAGVQSGPAAIFPRLVASGLTHPVAITNAHDGSGRMFITEQSGRVRVYDGSQILPTPFIDLSSLISYSSNGERGLLSVAFHPNYTANGYFYVYYTRKSDGAIIVARYHTPAATPNQADPASATPVLEIAHPETNHNGGQLQFGPDGYLYIGTGDGGGGGDEHGAIGNAQDLHVLLGKLLRIDVDGAAPYSIPLSNPFVGQAGARGEIWAYGLRNPWRFSFDRATGDLFIGDVGQNAVEEVDFQAAGSSGGQNYGWRCKEGNQSYNMSTSNCASATFTAPILVYNHASGCYAVTGGYRYRGARYPQLAGAYFYGDYCTGQIWGARFNGGWTAGSPTATTASISAFGEDESGELYFSDLGSGSIYQIAPSFNNVFLPLIER